MSMSSSGLFEAPFLYQPESIPLRRRENDAFISPSRRRRYSSRRENYFGSNSRSNDDHWCIRSAMKAILLSPIVVLLIWSIAAVAFTHRMRSSRGSLARGSIADTAIIIQPKFNTNEMPVVTQGQYYSFPTTEEQLAEQQAAFPNAQAAAADQYQPMQVINLPLPLEQQQQQQGDRTLNNAIPLDPPPLAVTVSSEATLPEAQPAADVAAPLMGMQPRQNNNNIISKTHLRHKGVRYFYYDPKTTTRDGTLFLPDIVYDTNGQAIRLQSLSAKKIYLEPPPRSIVHRNITTSNNSTMTNYTHPNTIHTPVHEKQHKMEPSKSLTIPDWGSSHASDSSVIVCTVGVMALLVGALSARKLRSRNMLSACIENETLEDEAAYDAIHTHHYNTFQQGWKGDLEKFDV